MPTLKEAQFTVFEKLMNDMTQKLSKGRELKGMKQRYLAELAEKVGLGPTTLKTFKYIKEQRPNAPLAYEQTSMDLICKAIGEVDFLKYVDVHKKEWKLDAFETDDLILSRQRQSANQKATPFSPGKQFGSHFIRITELSSDAKLLRLKLKFSKGVEVEIEVNPPGMKEDLEWYFERYLDQPYESRLRADKCKEAIKDYGQQLFTAIFKHPKTEQAYTKLAAASRLKNLDIQIASSSGFGDQIMWESLWDPKYAHPMGATGVNIYRLTSKPSLAPEYSIKEGSINILLVTAREVMEHDIDYRTVQSPLVNISDESPLNINLHILRPGTFRAFRNHLYEHPDHYHIVHFDMHGGVYTHEELEAKKESGQVKYHKGGLKTGKYYLRDGVGKLAHFEGEQAFLFFEDESDQKVVPYEAGELAGFLEFSGIPICFINACQSAKQTQGDFNNLAMTLSEGGIHKVIALRQSVSVSAVLTMVEAFYEYLLKKDYAVISALSASRKELFHRKNRSAQFDEQISLEDWVLPVTYINECLDFHIHSAKPLLKTDSSIPHKPFHGASITDELIGRDLDILRIERSLLGATGQLQLTGFPGVGKSALIRYLLHWWLKTQLLTDYWCFSAYHESLSLAVILEQLSQDLIAKKKATENQLKADPAGMLTTLLSQGRHALVFLDLGEQAQLSAALADFTRGLRNCLVIYESRDEISQLAGRVPVYSLAGLDEKSSFQLARRILNSSGIDFDQLLRDHRTDFTVLIREMQGNPATLGEYLPMLKNMSPQEVRDQIW